jgi:tRNA pseudouridine55 synthase
MDVPLPQPTSNIDSADFLAGTVLLVNKPLTWTSFDVVNKIRHRLKKRLGIKKIKVGHAGTLDPLATGLLIICTGKFTKRINEFQGMEKEYTGTIKLGASTPSYDAETEPDHIFPIDHINTEKMEAVRTSLTGDIEQLPPMFSAIKVDGQPLYKRARKGIMIEVKPRPVSIYQFDLTQIKMPEVDFLIKCSKGTYIRSIAHDFGKELDSGGHLTKLCRTKIGEFSIEKAWDLEELIEKLENS